MGKLMPYCGFDDEFDEIWALAKKAVEFTGKTAPRFLIIPTTAFDVYNRGTLNVYSKLGCGIDLLLLTQAGVTPDIIGEKIERADMIFVPGGNLKFLREKWSETGTDIHVKKAYERGALLFGTSAGAMCWFEEGFDNCAPYDEKMFTPGIGLRPYCVCPHFSSPNWKCFEDAVKTRTISGIAVEDGSALCLIDGENSVFTSHGTETCRFFDRDSGFEMQDLRENPDLLKTL